MTNDRWTISRRGFLAGVTAACAAPMIIPRHVLGDDKNLPANDKITVGCIGIGYMMYSSHMPDLLRMPELKVVAVSDVDTTRREAGQKRVNDAYGNTDCAAYSDYRELLARNDIHAIVCATPDHWHALVILDTCKAGKDLYCEKPLTNNLVEAKTVMDAVQASKIIFQTGSQQRSDNNFRYACELVRNGHIGKIVRVEVGVGGPPRPCNLPGEEMEPGLDWERWLGAAPNARLQLGAQSARCPQSFPVVAEFLRVWRGRDDGLGGAPFRHRAVGAGHGPVRTDRNRPSRKPQGRPRSEVPV